MAIITRKRADGSIAHSVVVYEDGKHHWIGTCNTHREAARLEANYEPSHSRSFTDYAKEWKSRRANVAPTTKDSYDYAVSKLCDYFGDADIGSITASQVEGFIATCGLAPLTVNVTLGVLERIMRSAVRDGLSKRDVTDDLTNVPKRRRKRDIRPLTKDEFNRLIEATPEFYRPLFGFWTLTGLRRGEVLGLRRSDIVGSTIMLKQQLCRGQIRGLKSESAYRTIPIISEAHVLLDQQLAQWVYNKGDLLFTTEQGYPIEAGRLGRLVFQPACKKAGIEGAVFHDLRHTYATWMLHAGVNVKVVAQLLGHANANITLRTYAHLMPDSQSDAASKLESFMR